MIVAMSSAAHAQTCNPVGRVDAQCHKDLQTATAAAIAANQPLWLPAGTYVLTQEWVIDYAPLATTGFQIISDGAVIDATATGLRAMSIECSGGTPDIPKGCFYFQIQGTLFVNANTSATAVRFGLNDFSDAHNSAKIDRLIVNNAGAGWGVRLNYILNADIFTVAVSAGSARAGDGSGAVLAHFGSGVGDHRHRDADRARLQLCKYDPGDRPRSGASRPDDQFALCEPQHLRVAILQLSDANCCECRV